MTKLLALTALAFILAGCGTATPSPTPLTDTAAYQPTASRDKGLTPSEGTFIPSVTYTLPEPTEYPTLVAEKMIEEYLRTNNNCDLPCFFGIIPGSTSLDDAVAFLQPFGITKDYGANLNILSKGLQNGASLFEENGKVIGFNIFGEGIPKKSSSFWDLWSYYLPQNIISRYGSPDRIWFYAIRPPEVADPNRALEYSVWFFYDKKNFLIYYSGITSKAPQYQVCLGKTNGSVETGYLEPSISLLIHNTIPLEDLVKEQRIYHQPGLYFEKDLDIPVDDFTKMIDKEGCFFTPKKFQP